MARNIGSPHTLNIAGQKFGEWTVTDQKFGNSYLCKCSCGTEKIIQSQGLKNGRSKSCGCKGRDWCRKHGMEGTKTYSIWASVKARCSNQQSPLYAAYGGIGVTIDPRWLDFVNFYADMGEKPDDMSLDRIDPFGGYWPENCRWADRKTQARNKRKTVYLEYRGQKKSPAEWAEIMGLPRKTVSERIRKGWSTERALETPNRKFQ